jgi:S-DNA-T family DNA segregation ATPase FtsK/SpoIIIE
MAKGSSNKKKSVSKVRSGSSAPKHNLPSSFWQQVVAFFALVFAIVMGMAIFKLGGEVPSAIFDGCRSLIGLVAYCLPLVVGYLAIKKMFSEGSQLAIGIHLGFIGFLLMSSGLVSLLFKESVAVENAGGEVGKAIKDTILSLMGTLPSFFVLLSLTVFCLMFVFKVQPKALIQMIIGLFKSSEHTVIKEKNIKDEDDGIRNIKLNQGVDVEVNGGEAAISSLKEKEKPLTFREKLAQLKAADSVDEKLKSSASVPAVSKSALKSLQDENWQLPDVNLLDDKTSKADAGDIGHNAQVIKDTFADFKIPVEMEEANVGPRVTQFTLKPPAGVKLSKIVELDANLALNLAAGLIRIEAPIPGKQAVGIEVPNKKSAIVSMKSIVTSKEWVNSESPLAFAIGKDIGGASTIGELDGMPHLLIAGQTGSGKSVMINALLTSLLYRNSPADMRMILVDPKQVELAPYNGIAHLLTPVIVEPEKTLSALKWAVNEMERRYSELAEHGVRNIKGYNSLKQKDGEELEHMPYIVIVIDELADLMMLAAKDVEGMIVRIAQKARAVGIHLVLATQRPSVNVITGLIKANIPARIAFTVASQIDSRTIIDQAGAEKLLGKGDMLMTTAQMPKPKRVQAIWVSDEEVQKIVDNIKSQRDPEYNDEILAQHVQIANKGSNIVSVGDTGFDAGGDEEAYKDAVQVVVAAGKASASLLQRRLRIGFGKASRIMEMLEENGVIGSDNGGKAREVLISGIPGSNDMGSDIDGDPFN